MEVYKRTLDECGKPMPKDLPMMREIFVARTREEAIRSRPYLEEKYKTYHQWGQGEAMPKAMTISAGVDELLDAVLFSDRSTKLPNKSLRYRNSGLTCFSAAFSGSACPTSR